LYGGDADIALAPVTTNDMAYYTVNFAVTNNSAEIGLFIANDGTNWVGLDNVTLTYYGKAINALKGMVASAKTLATSPMEASVATELAAAITQAEGVINSGSDSGVDDAINRLSAAMDAARQSVAMYAPLKTLIDNKTKYVTYPGYADYLVVLTPIEHDCLNGVYKTSDEIQVAIDKLQAADLACRWTNPYTPADFTFAIQNPSFENSDRFAGWINNGMASQGNGSFAPYKDGSIYVEKWISDDGNTGVPDVSVQQDLTNLPNGDYTLTASAQNIRQSVGAQPGGYIFAGTNQTEVGLTGNYSVSFNISDVDNGMITIGFQTISSGANWVACDNFRLMRNTGGLSGIKAVNPNDFSAFGIKDAIVVKSNAAIIVNVYSILGQLVRSIKVSGGETHISVPAGLYIVNGKKVIVK
jgi:hypothetical protein